MRRFALPVLLAAALPVALFAQAAMQKPGSPNPALVKAATYKLDPNHTLVRWTVDHMGFSPYFGLFGDVTGTLAFDPKQPNAAKLDVSIPVSKVLTANEGLTHHLLKPAPAGGKADFFGKDPADARFVSTGVVARGTSARVTGDFTLNGVTRPVTLDVRFYGAGTAPAMMGGGDNVGFTATGAIRRSEFGIGYGIPVVSDEVKLDITAAFWKG